MQNKRKSKIELFQIEYPNLIESPITGMTRQHWKDAALYLLKGAFSHIRSIDEPMSFPLQKGKSYPHHISQIPTVELEGFCRTLLMAAPLLKENPDLEIDGIRVSEYYLHQINKLIDPQSQIEPRGINEGPSQNLVELAALAISLFIVPEILWTPLSQSQKDRLANLMISYGDGPTIPSNWKFFNIFILSFYKLKGYKINEDLLVYYLNKTLEHYSGEGWYNDNPAYDYYSVWAFQTYGMFWSEFFGNRYYPDQAKQFLSNFKELTDYTSMFSRRGEMIMWGRSISYRFAAASVFPLMGFTNDSTINYGWIRRIASGTLLQFLQHPKFLKDGVPTLGFYGSFEPAVQNYNCRGSVYWCGKIFLGLLLHEDNPFWTATENEGLWESDSAQNTVYSTFSPSTNILLTNYTNIGASEIRAWCHVPALPPHQPFRGFENYINLSYNSAFPWQAQGSNGEVAMNYLVKNKYEIWEPLHIYNFKEYKDGIYYRDAIMETDPNLKFALAEIPFSEGILRIDKIYYQNTEDSPSFKIRLGHYALPKYRKKIRNNILEISTGVIHSIDNGQYTLGMIPVCGFDQVEALPCSGLNPEREKSYVINAVDLFNTEENRVQYYISFLLWKKSNNNWQLNDLNNFSLQHNNNSIELRFLKQKIIFNIDTY